MVAGWRGSAIGTGWQGETGATKGGTPVVRRSSARHTVVVSYERGFMTGQARGSRRGEDRDLNRDGDDLQRETEVRDVRG